MKYICASVLLGIALWPYMAISGQNLGLQRMSKCTRLFNEIYLKGSFKDFPEFVEDLDASVSAKRILAVKTIFSQMSEAQKDEFLVLLKDRGTKGVRSPCWNVFPLE
jgi:hypothetical protein